MWIIVKITLFLYKAVIYKKSHRLHSQVEYFTLPPMNNPVSDRLLSDNVYEQLLALLGTEGFEAGSRLVGELALAERFSVSRPVLRQALARLRSEGRIYSRKGSGNFVSKLDPVEPAVSFEPLASIPDVRSFLEFRLTLEGEIAALAAQRCNPDEVAEIKRRRRWLEEALEAGQPGIEEDIAFHAAIAAASGNRFFSITMAALAEQARFSISLIRQLSSASRSARLDDIVQEHARVEEAISAGDVPGARAAMTAHLAAGIARLFGK